MKYQLLCMTLTPGIVLHVHVKIKQKFQDRILANLANNTSKTLEETLILGISKSYVTKSILLMEGNAI